MKRTWNNDIAKILELFARERSVKAVVDAMPGITGEDVWGAVGTAAGELKDEVLGEEAEGRYKLNVDGSAVPNPGDAGIGVVVTGPDGKTLSSISKYIGHATNNIAEYTALLEGLREARKFTDSVVVCSDSELMVRQMTGVYRVKDPDIKEKYLAVKELEKEFSEVNYTHVLREYNVEADKLANGAATGKDGQTG